MYELDTEDMDVVASQRRERGLIVPVAQRLSYPLRRLTSDAITGQALGGLGGTLAGAGTGALLFGLSASIISRNRTFRTFSVSLGAVVGGSLGSTLGGVSGAATGLFFGLARLPFAIIRSIKTNDPGQLITPIERTVKGGWFILNNPDMARKLAEKPIKSCLRLVHSHKKKSA